MTSNKIMERVEQARKVIFGDFIDESKYEVDIGRRVDAESRYEQPTFSKMTRPC